MMSLYISLEDQLILHYQYIDTQLGENSQNLPITLPQSHQMQFYIQENYSWIMSFILKMGLRKNIYTYSKGMRKWSGTNPYPIN